MSNKLYVGNLSFSVNEDSVAQLFSECGSVTSSKIITDRETGRSKGFGFFEMSSADEAKQVISNYDGVELGGRPLRISIAKPQENRGGGNFSNRNRY